MRCRGERERERERERESERIREREMWKRSYLFVYGETEIARKREEIEKREHKTTNERETGIFKAIEIC